jgi:hypothetical protein
MMPPLEGSWRPVNNAASRALEIESAPPMNAKEWIAAYAEKLGTTGPTPAEFSALLDLAGEAAHSSERVAAPVACWVAAKAGTAPADALVIARELSSQDG